MAKHLIAFLGWLLTATLVLAVSEQPKKRSDKKPADQGLKVTVELPRESPTLDQVNLGQYTIHMSLKNTSKKTLTLWPFVAAQLLDAKGKPVPHSFLIGRWGLHNADSVLEEIPFVTLAPGKVHRVPLSFSSYNWDVDANFGWQLPAQGNYRLVLRYQFDRAAMKKRYGDGCKTLDDPKQPWNRALPVDKKIEVKLKVKAPS